MAKGSEFERQIAKELSLWWTDGARDDVFWRSTTSGARATTRAKCGKQTAGQYGDIAAIDKIGEPLINTITFELKAGYSTRSIHDILDRSRIQAHQTWEDFISKAYRSHKAANSLTWAIITKRTRRSIMIWFPCSFAKKLKDAGCSIDSSMFVMFRTYIRSGSKQPDPGFVTVFGCSLLETFLGGVKPKVIKRLDFERD